MTPRTKDRDRVHRLKLRHSEWLNVLRALQAAKDAPGPIDASEAMQRADYVNLRQRIVQALAKEMAAT